jgi:uncharacterized membrane protein
MHHENPRSTAKIAGHPIHPMTVMFPVVFFIGTWVCDIIFAATGELFWVTLGLLSLGLGLLTALVAAVFGMIDYFGDARVRAIPSANHHFVGNVLLTALQIGNFVFRMSAGADGVVPTGLILSTLAVLLLGYSGWKGATLVYEHGVGVDESKGASERHGPVAQHQAAVDSTAVGRQGR